MAKKHTVELFCGTKSFSKVAEEQGYNTWTTDVNKRFKPDLIKNIFKVTPETIPLEFHRPAILWASPPCTWFSVASAWKHWRKEQGDYLPVTLFATQAIEMIKYTLALIEALEPELIYIENPRGILRQLGLLDHLRRVTVTYCQYGQTRRKPTDIWTNNTQWQPRPVCDPMDGCHPDKTEDLATPAKKSVIPPLLLQELLKSSTNIVSPGAVTRSIKFGSRQAAEGIKFCRQSVPGFTKFCYLRNSEPQN